MSEEPEVAEPTFEEKVMEQFRLISQTSDKLVQRLERNEAMIAEDRKNLDTLTGILKQIVERGQPEGGGGGGSWTEWLNNPIVKQFMGASDENLDSEITSLTKEATSLSNMITKATLKQMIKDYQKRLGVSPVGHLTVEG